MRSGRLSNRHTSAPLLASSATTAPRTQGLSRCDDLPTYTLPSKIVGDDHTCAPPTAGSGLPSDVFHASDPLFASSAYTFASAAPKKTRPPATAAEDWMPGKLPPGFGSAMSKVQIGWPEK